MGVAVGIKDIRTDKDHKECQCLGVEMPGSGRS